MTIGAGAICIRLPWCPSANEIWRSLRGSGRPYLAPKYRSYLKNVMAFLAAQGGPRFDSKEPLQITLRLFPPHNRSYDIDNRIKPTLDGLTKSGFWIDDRIVRKLTVIANVPVEGGAVIAEVERYDEELERGYVETLLSWYGLKELTSPKQKRKEIKK